MDKAKFRSLGKSVLVLALIALCSGLLLGLVYRLTYVDPLLSTYERFAADTGASFSAMTDEEGAAYGDGRVVYYALSDDGAVQAFLAEGGGGFGGTVQLYVYLRGGKIEKITVGDHKETYMGRLEDAGFLQGFLGKDIASLDALATDGVAGATKSSNAVKSALGAVASYCGEHAAQGAASARTAPGAGAADAVRASFAGGSGS